MSKSPTRLLPVLLGAIALVITVKVGALWHGLALSVGTESVAQTQNNPPAPTQPNPAPPPANAPQANPPQANAPQANAPQAAQPAQPPAQPPATQPQAQMPAATTNAQSAAMAAGTPAASGQMPPAADASKSPDSASAIDPFNYTDEEVDVLQQLSKRRAELDARARQLDEREALVAAAEQRMNQKMTELKALQSTLQGLLKKRSAKEESQLQSLVKIYENMKPKAAASVFEELDMDILLEVVSRMKERKVAPILAQMSPTRAKELTFELAQQQQLPISP